MSGNDQTVAALLARLATTCDGALAGIALAVFAAQTFVKYKFTSKALHRIQEAPTPCISDLRFLLSDREPDSSSSSDTASSPSSPFTDGKLFIIRGIVKEGRSPEVADQKALVPHASGERAVVVRRTQTCIYNEWRGIFGWSFDLSSLLSRTKKERISCSTKSVPFSLVKGESFVNVKLDGSTQPLPLTTVYHQLLPVQPFSSSFIQAFFGNGYPVAILDEEKILPIGKEITAVGICKLHGGVLEIKSSDELPYFLSEMNKEELLIDLAINSSVLYWSSILLGTLAGALLGYAAFRNWRRWKDWRQRRSVHHQENETTLPDEDVDDGDVPDGQLCVVCLLRRRRSAFNPCGHLVCCTRCALMVERESAPKCPLCRQSIRSSIRIYAS